MSGRTTAADQRLRLMRPRRLPLAADGRLPAVRGRLELFMTSRGGGCWTAPAADVLEASPRKLVWVCDDRPDGRRTLRTDRPFERWEDVYWLVWPTAGGGR